MDRLIEAAKVLGAERSPTEISGRELAAAANVNYGLIHHYFGSKEAVFAEAVRETGELMGSRWDSNGILPVNTSDEARSYRTLAKISAADAERMTAGLVRRIARGHATATDRSPEDPELLAEVALCIALQFGWGAFEDEIIAGLASFGADRDALRRRVSEISMRIADS
jgi:AcrR family transcriptional regulator